MKTLTLLILLNAADGTQSVQGQLTNLDEVSCLAMQAQLWAAAEHSPVVYTDEYGPVHQLDAACVYEQGRDKLERGVNFVVYMDRKAR